jgi:hypothetical protein
MIDLFYKAVLGKIINQGEQSPHWAINFIREQIWLPLQYAKTSPVDQ